MEEIIAIIRTKSDLLHRYGVEELYIFGSYAKGLSQPHSDVDLVVKFVEPVSLFEFIRLKNELELALGRKVDLVSTDALHPALANKIRSEAVRAA